MIALTAEQEFLLHLLSLSLQGKHLDTLPDPLPDWKTLYRECHAQTVVLPVFDVLSPVEDHIPEDVKFSEKARRYTAGNLRTEHNQAALVSILDQANYPYVILKGQSSAGYYPAPELRQLGDIDFLVPSEHTLDIAEALKKQGYQHRYEPGDYHHVLEKPGSYLEMHIHVSGMPGGPARPAVEQFLSTIYDESILSEGIFGSYRTPCAAHHGMILILHMQHHTVEWGMGLRHIMDWACFINATAQESFWQNRLLPLLKQIGLMRFVSVITKMAAMYLGSFCPSWAEDAPEGVCQALMEDFLSSGNFGGKDQARKRAMSMLPNWEQKEEDPGKWTLLYRTLRASAVKTHPSLQHRPVSCFFYMCGKVIRYLVLYLQGKRPNLIKAAAHADRRRSVYDQLHMFEPEK